MHSSNHISVRIKKTSNDLPCPTYQTDGASGLDLYADIEHDTWLEAGRCLLVSTGIYLDIPNGFEAQIRPRSGLALKHHITVLNTPGTIDSDYRDEVGVILINHGKTNYKIQRGDRIAQMVFAPVAKALLLEVETLKETTREGGFGSTGV